MVRIRPGRSWRLNPGYLERLQALQGPGARRFDAGGILDVVGIEVDGVDIAAGVGEGAILLAVAELAEALARLADGAAAAQATVGPGPTDALLEARGTDVLLGLVRLSRPAKVLAAGLLVDGSRLRGAALQAVRGLLEDLLGISPALRDAPAVKRLKRAAQQLERKTVRAARPWPPPAAGQAVPLRSLLLKGGGGPIRCEVQVPLEAAERLAAPIEGAPLASLLARGTIALRVADGPAIAFEAPLYLALRDALGAAEALVQAWEAGERGFDLQLGPSAIAVDLTRDELRAPGWTRPAIATPPQIAQALAGAARTFATRALKLGPARAPRLEALDDLRDAAAALLRHCRDLASGELRRHPEIVAAPPLRKAPTRTARPLHAHGRVRRLVFRQAWSARLGGEPTSLHVLGREAAAPLRTPGAPAPGGSLAATLLHEAVGFDLETGARAWSLPCGGPHALCRAASGSDVFVLGPEALVRLDGATGQLRWRRKMQGGPGASASVFAVPVGVLACSRGSLALVSDAGTVLWRTRLEQPPVAALAHESLLLLSLSGGMVAALDQRTGHPLWRSRLASRAGVPLLCAGRIVAAAEPLDGAAPRVVALDAQSGQAAWTVAVGGPGAGLPSLVACGELIAAAAGTSLSCLRASDGSARWTAKLPWAAAAVAAAEETEDLPRAGKKPVRGPAVVAAGPGGAAALFDGAGKRIWCAEGDGDAAPQPPLLARGLVVTAGPALRLIDAAEGLTVAQPGPARPSLWAAAPDLTFAICEGSELRALRLLTHLSVVTT